VYLRVLSECKVLWWPRGTEVPSASGFIVLLSWFYAM
jgi:hypothetical protein